MRKPTLKTALKLQASQRQYFIKAKRAVAEKLGVTVGFDSPVLLDTFDGKVATYRLKGQDGVRKMKVEL